MIKFKQVKFSIRFSILTIFTTLLLIIGSTLVFFNYYAKNALFLHFAENTIVMANNLTKQKITNFLTPAQERVSTGAKIIANKLIEPHDNIIFTKFLMQLLDNQPNIARVYWSDPQGNFIHVERLATNLFNQEISSCRSEQCFMLERKIDGLGNILSINPEHKTQYDPRKRPWYIKTLHNKTLTFSDLYMFFERQTLGITISVPLYDNAQNLYGMLSMDIALQELSNFVANLHLTKNTNVLLFSSDNTLVAAKELQNYNSQNLPKVETSIKTPWIIEAMNRHLSEKNKFFIYTFNQHKYLAHYDSIDSGLDKLYIAIILPMLDITAPLAKTTINTATITFIVLLFGIVLICLISGNISRPITRLTKNAMHICELNLNKIENIKASHIKEVSYLQYAFMDIKQSLQSFIRYVPFSLVQNLMLGKNIAHVGGENKRLTFLFSDIQGFTSISENMQPQELANYLSEYFEAMTEVILKHNGTLDKYIGDAIMAFWGAPNEDSQHTHNACSCAIEMLHRIEILNGKFRQNNQPIINVRIGIHVGDAMIGNIGSNDRLNYTAIGDNVNLASRLESLNKEYQTNIIVSNSVYKVTKNDFDYRLLDKVSVRGKRIGGQIYELFHAKHKFYNLNYDIKSYNEKFENAFELYQQGKWTEAIHEFQLLLKKYPDDLLLSMYIERCYTLQHNLPENWSGTWKFG